MALDPPAHLDDIDRALVHALQIDGRAPFRRIGEVLGISDQTAARRYAKMQRTHALRVVALDDASRTEQVQWMLRVRAAPAAAGDIADALARRPDTSWISLCSGGTEIVATAYGAGVDPLLLDALPRTRHVLDVRADQVLHVFYGGAGQPFTKRGPLGDDQIASLVQYTPEPTVAPGEGPGDSRLLEILRHDGRASIDRLAAAAQVSASTVRRRLHQLRAGGVLHLDVDIDLGREPLARSMLWLRVAPDQLEAAGEALAAHPEVAFAAATTGATNIFASASSRDTAAVYRYLTTSVARLPGIESVETAPALRNVKAARTHYGSHRARGGG